MIEPDRPQMAIWRLRVAYCIHKAADRHSEYVTCIASTLQQWLHEHTSLLRFTYIDCIVQNMDISCFYLWRVT